MPQVSFPIFALTDKTLFGELPKLFEATVKRLMGQKMPHAILIYEVCDAPEWAHGTVKPAANPDRMVIMAFRPEGRDAIANAILNARNRVPQEAPKKKLHITAKETTPLRNIFKQMSEIPLSEFNITPSEAPDARLFFLRTPELIAGFRDELPKIVIS